MQAMTTHIHAFLSLRRTAAGISTNNFPETEKKNPEIALVNERDI